MQTKPILQTLAGEKTERPPFWFMRQAGRYLPEYRKLRAEKNGFLDMAFDPKSACEITIQPLRRFNMDAAIIFSDILTIPLALGQDLDFVTGKGPVLGDLNIPKLNFDDFDKLQPVYEALSLTKSTMQNEGFDQTTLIGFAGAPWTVSTYMIEGGSSRGFPKALGMIKNDRENFERLIDMITEATGQYLINQIKAGAEVVQIFDSWAGALEGDLFDRYSISPAKKIVETVRAACPDTPIIGFPKGAGERYPDYAKQTGITAIGIDYNIEPRWAAENLQRLMPVQGNLNPEILIKGGQPLEEAAQNIISELENGPHIFNLGHGINKETPIEHVEKLVEMIRG